jgi:uncharacterized protein (UPF0332 family)
LTPDELIAKVVPAARSASLLIDAGDADGACNRAYFAMFDAARAMLAASDRSGDTEGIRTHGGLISAFSLRLVKAGMVPVELGRALNRAAEARLAADYRSLVVGIDDARRAVQQAEAFVSEIRAMLGRKSSMRDDTGNGHDA